MMKLWLKEEMRFAQSHLEREGLKLISKPVFIARTMLQETQDILSGHPFLRLSVFVS